MAFKLTFDTRITTVLVFLTIMLVLEGAYPIVKDSGPAFFYYSLGAALFVSIGTGVYLVWKEMREDNQRRSTSSTTPVSVTPTPERTQTQEDQSSRENRELTFSNIILTYVATIVALAALGNDMYSRSGLPLLHLWIGTLFLLIGGMCMLYWRYTFGENVVALLATIICGIGAVVVFVLILMIVLNGTHPPPTASGNVTNICENCSYPVTNIVHNYNVTVVEHCSGNKNPSFSIEELKYLMASGRYGK